MYDVAVIGSGPAGASAAIFTAKAGKKTVMFDGDLGVTKRAWVRNHYGVVDVDGPNLVATGKQQAQQFGTESVEAKVTSVSKSGDGFKIVTESGEYEAANVIVATGFWTDLADNLGVKTKDGTEPRVKTIIDVDAEGRTNVPGVWAAGTVAGVSVHTIVTAGDGARVAINLLSELAGSRYVDHDVLKQPE
ncbi:FAD-dependent oxidoreductase [Alicyclobacillus sp. ALC3]|uniref:FAD-dependent oxidoreductase n=1 Tax=Alicyclobacillus sp. ALC3 TaxID=2796143 RepID=UPI002377DD4A|nr:FAD-dependent oxidoreductase [Alicyclobacillus sp. ALC3]WDL95404.1 FAD-dependent oxidoreductase [Alicyclobacillus sp. ALC3]